MRGHQDGCKADKAPPSLLGRRGFFDRVAHGTYGAALAYLLGQDRYGGSRLLADEDVPSTEHRKRTSFDLRPRATHFPPKAKAVIQL